MESKQIKKILGLLAEGTDPFTGEIYPADSPYHNPETIRALFNALSLIEKSQPLIMTSKKFNVKKLNQNPSAYDNELFEKLREIRHLISVQVKLPSYCIFPNKTLLEMSAAKPMNLSEMEYIKGIGNKTLKRYGTIFLAVINGQAPNDAIKMF